MPLNEAYLESFQAALDADPARRLDELRRVMASSRQGGVGSTCILLELLLRRIEGLEREARRLRRSVENLSPATPARKKKATRPRRKKAAATQGRTRPRRKTK